MNKQECDETLDGRDGTLQVCNAATLRPCSRIPTYAKILKQVEAPKDLEIQQ